MSKQLDKKTILIVEDEEPLQRAIKIKLEKSNFNVLTARKISQALNYLKDKDIEKISAIWLDHYLLGAETGFSFVVKIKKDKKFSQIPIYLVSNTADPDKVNAYIKLGINKYYLKANCSLQAIIKDIKKEV